MSEHNARFRGCRTLVCCSLMLLGSAPLASAQATSQSSGASASANTAQRLDDFIHFVNVANVELAKSNAQAILDSGISDEAFVAVIEDNPSLARNFERAFLRAARMEELEGVAGDLWEMFDGGVKARARNPERIEEAVAMLKDGQMRAQILARERLLEAGEYAVPKLIEELGFRATGSARARIQDLLIEMGQDAIAPIAAHLPNARPDAQERLCEILGQIKYPTALPYLRELFAASDNPKVREAARWAVSNITDGGSPTDTSVSESFRVLAEEYFASRRNESGGLVRFPNESHQLIWVDNTQGGLNMRPIRTEVFHETRAMMLSERALRHEKANERALAVWIASNTARELAQPPNTSNPMYPDSGRDARFYTVASGPVHAQSALAMALDDKDTALARRLIEALGRSTGGAAIGGATAERNALVRALRYSDRRVRYEAALVLAKANPSETFEGASSVVPILSASIRNAGARYAAVISGEIEARQRIQGALEGAGFTVLPPAESLGELDEPMARIPGLDVLVVQANGSEVTDILDRARSTPRLAATPVLGIMPVSEKAAFGHVFRADPQVRVIRPGVTDDQLLASVESLAVEVSGEALSEQEAQEYARRVLAVLEDLAIASGNSVYDVSEASGSLIASLEESTGDVQLRVGSVLSAICERRVQVALLDTALDASGDQQIALLERTIDSAHRCGNMIASRQIGRLRDLVESENTELATAASATIGALGLPTDQIVPIILDGNQ